MRRGFALLAFLCVGGAAAIVVACSDLKRAEEDSAVDGGDGGASDAEAPPEDAAVDVGEAPVDFQCSEPWTTTTKNVPECAPRQVKEIDEGAPDMHDISIARTPAGRVAIAFFAPQGFEEGEMRFLYFTPDTPDYKPKLVIRPGNFALQSGYHVKLAASGPDTVHILAHDVDQLANGDLLYMRLVDGKEPLTAPEVVVSALEHETEIALASDAVGNVFTTARVTTGVQDGGAPLAKLVASRKTAGGAFTAMPDLGAGMSPDDAPGVGAASLLFDTAGKQNVLFHFCEAAIGSQPVHHVFDGTQWSAKKTVDNGERRGISGFSPRLVVSGSQKIAAFYFRKNGQSDWSATADLRIVRWSGINEVPQLAILDEGIPSPAVPRHRMAMAIDVYGLLHIAAIRPLTPTTGRLDYYRETRVPGGGTKWLLDVVDEDVLGDDQDAAVDLVVDEKARPHIAYRTGKGLAVRYATRYDR